ncbi:MAG TPA: hypothetical protein VNA20_08025 [Frankiaceae bacterium]|nr:hypothetical protein [Frankiaceae bacterium]
MRRSRSVLAAVAATTALTAPLTPAAAAPAPLATKRAFAGGSVASIPACQDLCVMSFAVRPGERYLHVATTPLGGAGTGSATVALDVRSAAGVARVCHDTSGGPLDVTGLDHVVVTGVADAVGCGLAPSPGGTVLAIFSDRSVSYLEALRTYTPDPDRTVTGGVG